jgi:pyridoxamine 5'-phosphate oxidase
MNPPLDAEPDLELERDPYATFRTWYARAEAALPQPEGMALATVDGSGRPSLRMVLFKGFSGEGLRFFTNTASRKARELAQNPWAALLFHWHPLHRQVRIEGRVEPLAAQEADAYFLTRERESRLSAWASRQSEPVPARESLLIRMAELRERFAGQEVTRPAFWGGYRLLPEQFEFWQGRESRLHDRFRYQRERPGWRIGRLSP